MSFQAYLDNIHAKTGKKMWFETLPDTKFYASPILIDGKIYAASEQGDVYVIEANPNPSLTEDEDFAQAALSAGTSFDALITEILNAA